MFGLESFILFLNVLIVIILTMMFWFLYKLVDVVGNSEIKMRVSLESDEDDKDEEKDDK
jgi:hypothetical protein